MSRFAPFFGAATVLLVGTLAVVLASNVGSTPSSGTPSSVASSTIAIVTDIPVPEIRISADLMLEATSTAAVVPATATTTPNKPVKKIPAKPALPPTTTSSAPVSAAIPAPVITDSASLDAAAATLRNALVNIICYAPGGSRLKSISGSGVIIDSKGIILTNAHIAQYFLLDDRGVSCTIRSGAPAVDAYEAELIYISPLWINANATILTQSAPTGTGEYDFAFLAVTASATSKQLPSVFPSIALAELPPSSGTPVVIASYGAQFLESSQIQSSLFPTMVFGSIKDIFTFVRNTIDVIELGGSAAAQEGSSGGGIADGTGSLVGTITTSTVEGPTDTRSLSGITASYIRGEYASETGTALDFLLNKPILSSVADFAPQIPVLEAIITAHLD